MAFIGAVSNVASLCATYSWLSWICTLPDTVVGIIQGVLPPLLLAVLMMLLPIVLRLLARFEGIPRRSGLELSLMSRYFMFQIIVSLSRVMNCVWISDKSVALALVLDRHVGIRYHCLPSRSRGRSVVHPDDSCAEFAQGVQLLPDVRTYSVSSLRTALIILHFPLGTSFCKVCPDPHLASFKPFLW